MANQDGHDPKRSERALPPVPRGLQDIIVLAAADSTFHEALIDDPDAALAARRIRISAHEYAILRAVPRAQLDALVRNVADPAMRRRRFLAQSAASATALIGAGTLLSATGGCDRILRRETAKDGGASPDLPPPPPPPPPLCELEAVVGKFSTLSGPDRSPGEADIERVRAQLQQTCGTEFLTKPGKLTYEMRVDPAGTVSEVKTIENTTGSVGLDTIMKRHLERIVYFEAGEPSLFRVTLTLEGRTPAR
jgi:hypothetical protein